MENTVEILLKARDEASQQVQQFNRHLAQTGQVSQQTGQALAATGQRSAAFATQMRTAGTTNRFLAASLLSEVNPQLGIMATRLTSLTSLAGRSSGALGLLATGGIAVVATALGVWISRTNAQIDAQVKLNRQVREFDATGIAADIREVAHQLDRAEAFSRTFIGIFIEFGKTILGTSGSMANLRARLVELRQEYEKVRPLHAKLELARTNVDLDRTTAAIQRQHLATVKSFEEAEGLTRSRMANLERQHQGEKEQLRIQERIEVAKAESAGLSAKAVEDVVRVYYNRRLNLDLQYQQRRQEIEQDGADKVKAIMEDMDKDAEAATEGRDDADRARWKRQAEEFRRAQERIRAELQRTADAVANVFSDTLFDGLKEGFRSVGDVMKSVLINAARETSRGMFREFSNALFGLRSGGGGSFFNMGQAGGVAAAGVPMMGAPGAGGGGIFGNIGQTFRQLFGVSGVPSTTGGLPGLTQPGLVPGTATTGAAVNMPAGLSGAGGFLGTGVSFLGLAGSGLAGAGIGATLHGNIPSMALGGLFGIGGAIGGAALGSALGVAAGSLLGSVLPGVGTILGGVAGSFLGNLFGGQAQRRVEQRQRNIQAATAAMQAFSGALSGVQVDNPAVAGVVNEMQGIARVADDVTGRAGGFFAFWQAAAGVAQRFAGHGDELRFLAELRSALHAQQFPGAETMASWLLGNGHGRINVAASFPATYRLLTAGADALFREGRLRTFGPEAVGIGETLFDVQLAERGIRGVQPLLDRRSSPQPGSPPRRRCWTASSGCASHADRSTRFTS